MLRTSTKIDGHFLLESLLQINHVTAVNPSTAIRMRPIGSRKKTNSSTPELMARPFEEILVGVATLDAQGNVTTKELDSK